MTIRELVVSLGMKVNDTGFRKAEERIGAVKQAAQGLATVVFSGAAAAGLTKMVRMASDVTETTNVINAAFGQSAQAVESWASGLAGTINRSQYELRGFASDIGAMISPILGSKEAAADLSMTISELAMDLGSFYTSTDREALQALKSGLIGEPEPLRNRFGVTMVENSMKEFIEAQGIKKSLAEMTEAEKVMLRFQFIMSRTTLAQGDAAKTANEFANSAKGVRARISDLSIMGGMVLLPVATRVTHVVRDLLDGFAKLIEHTKIVETTFAVLGSIAAAVGMKLLLPFAPAIFAASALAGAIGTVILAIEDLVVFMKGGESLIEQTLGKMGISADKVRGALAKVGEFAQEAWRRVGRAVKAVALALAPAFERALARIELGLEELVAWAKPKLDALLDMDVSSKLDQVEAFFAGLARKVGAFAQSSWGKVLLGLLGAYVGSKVGNAGGTAMGGVFGRIAGTSRIPGSEVAGEWLGKQFGGFSGSLGGALAGMQLYKLGVSQAPQERMGPPGELAPTIAVPAPAVSRNVRLERRLDVNITGTASEAQKDELRRIVREENERDLRQAAASLLPSFAPG